MNIQFIEHNGQRQYAIVPAELYAELVKKAEMLDGIKSVDSILDQDEDEDAISDDALQLLVTGESKLKVWREYRGLTQTDLSKQVGVSQSTIAQLESGKRAGTLVMFKKLAQALNVDLDDLV